MNSITGGVRIGLEGTVEGVSAKLVLHPCPHVHSHDHAHSSPRRGGTESGFPFQSAHMSPPDGCVTVGFGVGRGQIPFSGAPRPRTPNEGLKRKPGGAEEMRRGRGDTEPDTGWQKKGNQPSMWEGSSASKPRLLKTCLLFHAFK